MTSPAPALTATPASAPPSRPRARVPRSAVVIVGAVVLACVVLALATARQEDVYLDPQGTGRAGMGALVQVLTDHGVRVHTVTTLTSLDATLRSLDPGSTTVAVGPSRILGTRGAHDLLRSTTAVQRLVMLDAGPTLAPHIHPDLRVLPALSAQPLTARCPSWTGIPEVELAALNSRIVRDPTASEGSDDATPRWHARASLDGLAGCFPLATEDEDPAAALRDGAALAVLPATAEAPATYLVGFGPALTNATILDADHAALALTLLGASEHLVIYTPDLSDAAAIAGEPDRQVPLPPALGPALALIAVAFVLYAVARGRRFGPLVREPLPVVVRASETTHARAELYRAASDRERAAQVLRRASTARLAHTLRLPPRSSATEVADAARAHGIPRDQLLTTLAGPAPTTDAALLALAHDLADLEEKVTHA